MMRAWVVLVAVSLTAGGAGAQTSLQCPYDPVPKCRGEACLCKPKMMAGDPVNMLNGYTTHTVKDLDIETGTGPFKL